MMFKNNGKVLLQDDPAVEMKRLLDPEATSPAAVTGPAPADQPAKIFPEISGKGPAPAIGPEWKKKDPGKAKTALSRCIVVDKDDHWNEGAMVELKGTDPTPFTWGYYGTQFPVLVESAKGLLLPFYLPDFAGESSNRLFKGANPEGFKSTFKHHNTMLQKLQIGLMVALVLGLFFLMFILINNKPAGSGSASGILNGLVYAGRFWMGV